MVTFNKSLSGYGKYIYENLNSLQKEQIGFKCFYEYKKSHKIKELYVE